MLIDIVTSSTGISIPVEEQVWKKADRDLYFRTIIIYVQKLLTLFKF
jgi:hypothetical protein